jgi:hypothetical protein
MRKLILAAALAVGCDDLQYRGPREAPLAQEDDVDDTYVSHDGGSSYTPRNVVKSSAYKRMQREIAESTIAASNLLAYGHSSFWSKKRIVEHGEADALWKLQEDDDDKGPSEERMGASDSQSPAWVGKPLGVSEEDREPPRRGGVSTGKALGRFFFGTGDERL